MIPVTKFKVDELNILYGFLSQKNQNFSKTILSVPLGKKIVF